MRFFRSFILLTFGAFLLLSTPMLAHAADATSVKLYNPLLNTVSEKTPVQSIAKIIINTLFGIVGSVALAMFVWGGFLWTTSMGNSKQVEQGKQVFIWSTVGILVMFSAYVVLNFLFTNLTAGGDTTGTGTAAAPPPAATGLPTPPVTPAPTGPTKVAYCCYDGSKEANLTAVDDNDAATQCSAWPGIDSGQVTVGKCDDLIYCADGINCGVQILKTNCTLAKYALNTAECKLIVSGDDSKCNQPASGKAGVCMQKADCPNSSTIKSGLCSGGPNRKCCIPK